LTAREHYICFDRTMEGRRGMSVSEWTYFLDNYEEVIDHGIQIFGGEKPLPPIDVETIRYTSMNYGSLRAVKRAYMVPNDQAQYSGWLILLDVEFGNRDISLRYQRDLVETVARDIMWSEYALSYDTVLMNTQVYPTLIAELLGEDGSLPAVPRHATVLDLGAGTGNITERLVVNGGERLVVAVENNRTMLAVLRTKVRPYLRTDGTGCRVVTIKQDITTLLGLEDEYFDFAIANNVLYAVDDVAACLREVYRVLRPGGEIRISGPQKRTRLDRLLGRIKRDLEARGVFDDVADDYERARIINQRRLAQWLYRWDIDDMRAVLIEAGFKEVFYANESAYGGEAMLVAARK
jgi:ubiquinone/menaquinone biosynthesis C-methylase UbiE